MKCYYYISPIWFISVFKINFAFWHPRSIKIMFDHMRENVNFAFQYLWIPSELAKYAALKKPCYIYGIIILLLLICFYLGDAVNVQWSSNTGPHSCSFSIEWLKKYDYASPYLHEERRKEEEPLVAVCVNGNCRLLIEISWRRYV